MSTSCSNAESRDMASDIRFFGWAAGAKADFSPKPFGGRGAVFDRDACLDYRYEIDPEAAEAARLAELREREDECWEGCDEA